MSTYQEIFDKAAAGIIAQGCKSMIDRDGDPTCAYRGENGHKCALGHLLSDSQIYEYSIKEGSTPSKFPIPLIKELVTGEKIDDLTQIDDSYVTGDAVRFLEGLQEVHDFVSDYDDDFVGEFRRNMNEFAIKWGLKEIE